MMNQMDEMYLAGDIGGTKTRLALFPTQGDLHDPLEFKTFPSQDYASLEDIIREFLKDKPYPLSGASLGIAGPIIENHAQVTNLSWVVDSDIVSKVIGGHPVALLNDLHAIASAIPYLKPSELETLVPGEAVEHGALGVIAPGTGLGEGFLVWDGKRYQPHPSEGGHSSFGPQTPLQLELLNYMDNFYEHVSYERVCSGLGIANLYKFLRDGKGMMEPDWLRDELHDVDDPTPIISLAALEEKAEICKKTMELFVSILGNEAGNLALKVLATGGIYMGGGIPKRILPLLKTDTFRLAFTNKGRFAEMLWDVPVYVITHPRAGLFGAACHGLLPRGKTSEEDAV